jgi:hypothetical protein
MMSRALSLLTVRGIAKSIAVIARCESNCVSRTCLFRDSRKSISSVGLLKSTVERQATRNTTKEDGRH